MPQPKKRHSNARQGKRRASNYTLSLKTLSRCSSCGAPTLPHHACPVCGTYRDRPVVKVENKEQKAARKGKGKEQK
jgi:large subunit ribosomal protein L32